MISRMINGPEFGCLAGPAPDQDSPLAGVSLVRGVRGFGAGIPLSRFGFSEEPVPDAVRRPRPDDPTQIGIP